jgi:hypothetical protein
VRIPLTQTLEVETLAASSPILFPNYDYQVVLEIAYIVKSQRNPKKNSEVPSNINKQR